MRNATELATRLAEDVDEDFRAYDEVVRALLDPPRRAAMSAALREVLRAQSSTRASFALARDLLANRDVDGFRELLRESAEKTRMGALDALAGFPERLVDVMAEVRVALGDTSAAVRARACSAVKGAAGTKVDVTALLPSVVAAMSDADEKVRFDATWAVALLVPKQLDPRVVESLVSTLGQRLVDGYVYTREAAAKALWYAARRGVDISSSLAALRRAAAQKSDPLLAKAALGALAAAKKPKKKPKKKKTMKTSR